MDLEKVAKDVSDSCEPSHIVDGLEAQRLGVSVSPNGSHGCACEVCILRALRSVAYRCAEICDAESCPETCENPMHVQAGILRDQINKEFGLK